jgi:beta-lactamase superfamily II metal-dependent hydrolase
MSADQLVIRMYNTGFGDCFLLTIPTAAGPRRMLIDCGTHPASTGPRQARRDAVPLLFSDLQAEAGKLRIDVVVASHRHRDHLSGFEAPEFRTLEVGEVWMPWTENPDDPVATALRERMGITALALAAARQGIERTSPAVAAAVQELLANDLAIKNEASMETLWTGFLGHPTRQYLSARPEPLETPLLPGVRIHLLGPMTDEKTIRTLEPPKKETFAHVGDPAVAPATVEDTDEPPLRPPFDDEWATPAVVARKSAAFKGIRVSGQIVGAIRDLAADELLAAAASMTSSINGTSLMFVLEFGGLFLFFPGDAQWGTWKKVLDDPKSRALLQRCTFYKVGHHGSHNASPRTFIEEVMSANAVAAVPVAPVKVWPAIPQTDLVDAIKKLPVTVVQSNPPPVGVVPNVTVRGDQSIDFAFDVPMPPP